MRLEPTQSCITLEKTISTTGFEPVSDGTKCPSVITIQTKQTKFFKCKRIVRPSISLITYSQSCYPWFIIVFRSGPIQIASMHLPHKARLGVNTISSKNLEGFCSQAQIWFTARNAPVKTSKVFVHYFFLSPVCEIYTMPPVEYYVVNRKTGMVGFGPTTY